MRSERVKRAMDVLGATLALTAAAPVMVVVAAAIRFDMGAPVLFRQQRPGRRGEPFYMLKFRSMRDATDRGGAPLPDSERLTRLGRWLRSTSLDELPELFNVLRGSMSLVGPRPLLMEYLPLYTPEQMRRHDVAPGVTGWAQINGRNALGWHDKFRLDCWYVDNWSNEGDVLIILRTLGAVFSRRGISHAGDATMPKFDGAAS